MSDPKVKATSIIDPKAFLAMNEADRAAYLATLSPEDQASFQAQVAAIDPNRNGGVTAPLPTQISPVVNPNAPTVPKMNLSFNNKTNNLISPEEFWKMSKADKEAYVSKLSPEDNIIFSKSVNKGLINGGLNTLDTISTAATTMIDSVNTAYPEQANPTTSAIATGVSGAISGAKFGPVGAVAGGLLGALSGGLKAGGQREAYEENELSKEKKRISGLRIAPSSYETGGVAKTDADPELELPVQEEEGEIMLFPDGRLVDSMATKTHKQMKDNQVTDFIPDGTLIFSNSKKKLIDLTKIKDHVFTITKGHYSEDGNTPGETVTMGDIYGTRGKKTPAALAKMVRKMLPVIEEPKEQFQIETNMENLRKRAELLLPIMEMQEGVYKKFEYEKPMTFEKGGIARKKAKKKMIPKYEGGTDGCGAGFKKDADGNCVPDIPALSTFNQSDLDKALFNINDPEYRGVVASGVQNYAAMMSGDVPPEEPVTDGLVTDDTKIVKDPEIKLSGVTNPLAPPENIKRVPPLKVTIPQTPMVGDDVFKKADDMMAADRQNTDQQFDTQMAANEDLYKSQKFRNFGILMSKLTGTLLQKPTVEPVAYGTELVDGMFPKISESEIKQQLTPIRKSQNRVLQAVNDSGISGSQVGSSIASTQARLIEAEGEARSKAGQFNKNQEGRRFEKLKTIRDLNTQNAVAAENATTSNRNALVANTAGIGADSLKAAGSLQEALYLKRQELNKWKQENQNVMSQNEFNNIVKKEELRIKREWNDKVRTDLADILSKYIQQ